MRVIAIDGPAGSGKSTIGRALAERLGLEYLDTGAMYRAVAFAVLRDGLDPADDATVAGVATSLDLVIRGTSVMVDGADASRELRSPEVTRTVSIVAANPAVRSEMVDRQRAWAAERNGGVIEGRDIGSVVFPDADLKVYLTARPEVRAARRTAETAGQSYEAIAADMARRDALDTARAVSPLTRADGAIEVDTSDLSIGEIVDELMARLG